MRQYAGPERADWGALCGARGSGSTRLEALRLLLQKPVDRAAGPDTVDDRVADLVGIVVRDLLE